jgi:hypothetical protein
VTSELLNDRFREIANKSLPLPASGHTKERHHFLSELGRECLSLARLAEAHFDAVSILAEAGRTPEPGALYGVWAAEIPGQSLIIRQANDGVFIDGNKVFCSGANLVDRALITVSGPDPLLVDVDLRSHPDALQVDLDVWKAAAFRLTNTATITFSNFPTDRDSIFGEHGWYFSRPGFWHGACGPAACWAGGAIGLIDYARNQSRSDPHTMAHLGALHALQWQMETCLDAAGREIDSSPLDKDEAHRRALTVRHLIEQSATEVLRRFGRAYGPKPLAFDEGISLRYQELDIYLRQSHAERDLGDLGQDVSKRYKSGLKTPGVSFLTSGTDRIGLVNVTSGTKSTPSKNSD